KKLLEAACPALVTLLGKCAALGWSGIDLLCKISPAGQTRGVHEAWLRSLQQTALVEPIRQIPLLMTCGTKLVAPSNAWIPLSTSDTPLISLWELASGLTESDTKLVEKATAASWEENLRGWGEVLGLQPEDMHGSLTLKDCASI